MFKQILVLMLAILLGGQSIFGMDFGALGGLSQEQNIFSSSDLTSEAQEEGYEEGEENTAPIFSDGGSLSENTKVETDSGLFSDGEDSSLEFSDQENLSQMEEQPSQMVHVITYPRIVTEGGKKNLGKEVERLREEGMIREELAEVSSLPETVSAQDNACSTLEDCGSYMRQAMVNRETTITLRYQVNKDYESGNHYWEDILNEAEKHTGVGNEGDYLLWGTHSFHGRTSFSGGTYTLLYEVEYYTDASQEAVVTQRLQQVYGSLSLGSLSLYEKIKKIYDFIMDTTEYDYDHLNDSSYSLKYTAYAALINGTSVCQGYGLLLYRMLLDQGIDNRCVTGDNHLWNIVEIYGKYYNVDCTWDDQKTRTYTYFLKCDASFSDHTREDPYNTAAFYAAYPMSSTNYTGQEMPTSTPVATSTPSPTNTPLPTSTPSPTNTPLPTRTPLPTSTPSPTSTPLPTSTPKPTSTPLPTSTPKPTSTPSPTNTPLPTSTPSPTNTPLPTTTPSPTQRAGYRPQIDSQEDGFEILGLEYPIAFPEGYVHTFEVCGASAEVRYFGELVPGDIKWSPYCWGTPEGLKFDIPEGDEDQCYTSRSFQIGLTGGQYHTSRTFTLLVYFKAFRWDGNRWQDTQEVTPFTTSFTAMAITPTPGPEATPTSTPIPTEAPEESFSLLTTELTLYVGASNEYKKGQILTSQTLKSKKYTSSNKKVAKVSKTGLVTAVGAGEATITVTLTGSDQFATCHVTVLKPTLEVVKSIKVKKKKKVTLQVYAYPAGKIKFKSSNKSIATVNSKGVVKGKKKGKTYITVTCNKVSQKVLVKVT